MVGCSGKVSFPSRATLCGAGARVCTSAQWVAWSAGQAPTYHYWVDDGPRYYRGTDQNGTQCAASDVQLVGYGACNEALSPMRVCRSSSNDPLNNICNWTNCGWKSYSPNRYFGGCNDNYTSGALCCPM